MCLLSVPSQPLIFLTVHVRKPLSFCLFQGKKLMFADFSVADLEGVHVI